MRLADEIIDLAVDDKTPLPVLLRKCLVLSRRLKNSRLQQWVEKELDGYADDDALPDYRQTSAISKGDFFGPTGPELTNYPIPTLVLEEEDQIRVDMAQFRAGIGALQPDPDEKSGGGRRTLPWNPNLVLRYRSAFGGNYSLVHAWQEVPGAFIALLNDTIRNRVLKFALELQEELGAVSDDLAALPREFVERNVINQIFGGQVVIADHVGNITQAGSIVVAKGDLTSLTDALKQLGVSDIGDVQALEDAIAEDAATTSSGLGQRTLDWIKGAAFNAACKLVSTGGNAALEVAKAQMTAQLTKWVSQFLGMRIP